ncbi:hypothetical protein AUC43_08480 [Hymenobacter sedentarius]|uniref:Uncharacterized protein n=1 Tax=Hymenobacter sedentarius TaxID=1411621 RepID=A0A0U3SG54_9BACT|nr:hypothetical protein [Hymenobacter sedentarius]ALW85124.1 hypothetical protein AUC43_08480 [Hymenobacter sedentarius]
MSRKNELLISGVRLSAEDIEELQGLVISDETEVVQLETKSAFNDLVQVVFNDFSLVTLVRDYVVTEAITSSYNYIKPVIQSLKKKGIGVTNVCINKDMTSKDGVAFNLYVVTRAQKFEIIIKELEEVPIDKLTSRSRNNTIVVRHDKEGKLDIFIIGD